MYICTMRSWLHSVLSGMGTGAEHQRYTELNPFGSHVSERFLKTPLFICMMIRGFPEMGVPSNHPFIDGFSILNYPYWGTPMAMETPFYGY